MLFETWVAGRGNQISLRCQATLQEVWFSKSPLTYREVTMGRETKSAAQAVVGALMAEQVDVVFGLAGSHILAVCDALIHAEGIRFVTCKHENNAALMADAYGRLTQRPGVCLVTAGPGATNSMTGVAQAFAAASPVVHISGTVPRRAGRGAFHGLDRPTFLREAFAPVTKWSARVDEVEDTPRILAEAFSIANSGRPGPVHVELPEDVLKEPPTEVWDYARRPAEAAAPDSKLVDRLAEMLISAERPMICAGVGVRTPDARADLLKLAESLGAAVTFPRSALGAFPSAHHLCAGSFNTYPPNPFPMQLVEESDLLLVVGMRAGTTLSEILDDHAPEKYVYLTPEGELDRSDRATLSVSVDTEALLRGLAERVAEQSRASASWAESQITTARQALRAGAERTVETYRGHKPIHFALVLKELWSLLQKDAVVVADIGNHGVWASWWYELYGTQTYLEPGQWGAMGFALPGAIAAKLIRPDRQVVGLTGDGAFLMSCSDFGTALEEGTKVVIVVLNDQRYGMIHALQTMDFGRTFATELRSPDLVKFAESFGALGIRVEDGAELPEALSRALDAEKPVIVDVACGYDFPHPAPVEWLGEGKG
jgi:acetolactate synthase-1/2/3 large subunit